MINAASIKLPEQRHELYQHMENLARNLFSIVEITGARSRAEIADRCDINTATFTRYATLEQAIPILALKRICEEYGPACRPPFSYQEFLTEDLLKKQAALRRTPEQERVAGGEYAFYAGTYLMYLRRENGLGCGVLHIYQQEGGYRVLSRAFLDAAQAEAAKAELEAGRAPEGDRWYRGSLQLTRQHIFIAMASDYYRDSALLILPNKRQNRDYIGGLGLINSVVKAQDGTEQAPRAQKLLLSRWPLAFDNEAICEALALFGPQRSEPGEEWMQFAGKLLYLTEELSGSFKRHGLGQADAALIIANNARMLMEEFLRTRLPHCIEAGAAEDKRAYTMIKLSRPGAEAAEAGDEDGED